MEHSDYSCKAYCPWLDESPTSLRIIDSQTEPRQKVIPKKMKKLIDGDLAAISGKRSAKDRLKEKLRKKQEAKEQYLQETGNKDVAVNTDVERKSGKQKKRRKRSKKAHALDKQENEAQNEDEIQVESNEKVEVGESGKKLDGEISVPVDKVHADTLLAEIEELRKEISVLVNNKVNGDTLIAESEKLDVEISELIYNKVNSDKLSAETEKLSKDISVPIDYELNIGTLLAEIEKLDREISVPIDNQVNAYTLLTEIEKLSEEIFVLFDDEGIANALLAEIEKLNREVSEPVDHQMNADTFFLKVEKPGGEFSVHIDMQKGANKPSAVTEKFSGEITEPFDNKVNAGVLLAEKPDEEILVHINNTINTNTLLAEITKLREKISHLVNNKVNTDTLSAEIGKFSGDVMEPIDNKVNSDILLAEIEKFSGEHSVPSANQEDADTYLADIERFSKEIPVPVDNLVNADTLLLKIEMPDGEISESINIKENANTPLAEIEKFSRERTEPIDYKINLDTLLADIEKVGEDISNFVNNKVNADTLIAEIEKLNGEIVEPTDKTANADTVLAEMEKLSGEISVPIDYELNINTLLAEIKKLDGEISVPIENKVNADTLLAEIEKLSEKISVLDNEENANALFAEIETLSREISEPLGHQINAHTSLAEVEEPVEMFSVPNLNHVDADTHLADIEKPNTDFGIPIDNISNANTLLAEIENLSSEIFVPTDYKINADTLHTETEKLCVVKPVHVDNMMNADTLLAKEENLDTDIFVPADNTLNADTHVAEIVMLGGVIPAPVDNKTSSNIFLADIKMLDGDTSVPIDIKINAYTLLAEIEKLSEEISVLVDSKTNVDTLLAEIEKLNRDISEPIHYKVNNDILLAEVAKFWSTISEPVYNKVNADTLLTEIQKLAGDISVPVDKDGVISSPRDNKLNANTILAETDKERITQAAQGASKKFTVSGQFRRRMASEEYSIVADNFHKKLSRNHRVEILMSERKKLVGNMKSEVEPLRKKRIGKQDKVESCINIEILLTGESQKLESNKVYILSPEMIKCLDVATTGRLGCKSGFELYSVTPSHPSITKHHIARKFSDAVTSPAKHLRLECVLIKQPHKEVLHMHLDISKEKTYTCQKNFKQKTLKLTKMIQSPLVNENSECDVKYYPVFSTSPVISHSTQHKQIISITFEIKIKKRLLANNLMDSQELRDHLRKIITRQEDVGKIGLLFMEGINHMKKMSKTALELIKCTGVSNSVFMSQIGLSHLFILCCDSGPALFDFLAAVKIHGIPNTCMSTGITCSSEKLLTARMRRRFVLTILCPSATGRRPALPNAICNLVDPVDFTQSDLRMYSTIEGKESALKVVKPWVKMKTKYIMNIHSTLQNIKMRQKPAAAQMVQLCKKANMIGSKITFRSHYDKILLSVNDAGLFNYTDMYLQGQQEVLLVLETHASHTSQRDFEVQFMNFKIPIAVAGNLIKPVANKEFVENGVRVHHFEDLDADFNHLKEMNILQNKVGGFVKGGIMNIHQPNGNAFKGKIVESDVEIKIREKNKYRGSPSQGGNFLVNKEVNAQFAYKKRKENVHIAALSIVDNLRVLRKQKNLTFRCYDDGIKAFEKYGAFDGQTVARSAIETTAIEAAHKYIAILHEQILKKLAVKRKVKQQTETVKILLLNIFPRYARRHGLLKLRNSDRSVTAETVQETNNRAVERLAIGDSNTPCSQINDDAPGQIHSEHITIIDNLEQTHYGIKLCMFD